MAFLNLSDHPVSRVDADVTVLDRHIKHRMQNGLDNFDTVWLKSVFQQFAIKLLYIAVPDTGNIPHPNIFFNVLSVHIFIICPGRCLELVLGCDIVFPKIIERHSGGNK